MTDHKHIIGDCNPVICTKCEQLKWGCEFRRIERSRWCRPCEALASREYRASSNKKTVTALVAAGADITLDEYDALLAAHDGKCKICKKTVDPDSRRKKHSMDHDHVTGKVRDFLCSHCNLLLGLANDDPKVLESAAAYLRHHASQR